MYDLLEDKEGWRIYSTSHSGNVTRWQAEKVIGKDGPLGLKAKISVDTEGEALKIEAWYGDQQMNLQLVPIWLIRELLEARDKYMSRQLEQKR